MLVGAGKELTRAKERRRAAEQELARANRRLDLAEQVIAGVASRLSSLAYASPELRPEKLEELADVADRLIGSHTAAVVGETDTQELEVAA